MRTPNHHTRVRRELAAALIIVLAFVVLLTGVVVAYLSSTTTDRQLAHGTFNEAKADELARGALDIIVGDLKQEIADGSASPAPTPGGVALYKPSAPANMLPMRSGNPGGVPDPIPNLVRRSVRSDGIAAPGVAGRASAVNSVTDVSLNGRSLTLSRWNKHYLIPKATSAGDATDPVASFVAPDWVFVSNAGPSIITAPNTSVVGRYAFTTFDEGGLIDINAAGYPANTEITQYGRKGSLAFADLTTTTGTTTGVNIPQTQVDEIVGWRNYATAAPSGDFSAGFSFNSTATTKYLNYVFTNTSGFLSTPTTVTSAHTDQLLVSRQELIRLQSAAGFSVNSLQYLTHFSREAEANVPQWTPATVSAINPDFQTLRVTGPFARNDGTSAKAGDPLVNKRFLLQRLNWLTYKGPSANRTIPAAAPASATDPDYDMWLATGRFGLTTTFLAQGTAANITKYFGLVWDATNERWNYVGHAGGTAPIGSLAQLGTLTGSREPDFFELLQAGIINSSVGDASSSDAALPIAHQQSKMLHLVAIGANLIAQARTDSYPVRIAIDNGSGVVWEAVGCSRLPYVNGLGACPVAGTGAKGGINWFLVPNLWDPFRDTWDLTEANVGSSLTPAYPRPAIRLTVQGTAGFGSVTTAASVQSGNVGGVTAFPASSLTFNASLPLKSAAATGRDGFAEANRLGSTDAVTAPTTYTTTTSPAAAASAFSAVTRPPRTNGTVSGSSNVVVFRLSLPGSSIPVTALAPPQNPVLILNSGFQVTVDYQSANGTWYPYSYLQGTNATNTWSSANINLAGTFSQYGTNAAPSPTPSPSPSPASVLPTVVNSGTSTATLWDMTTLAKSPLFTKSDPRSIRYNSGIGVIDVPLPNPAPTAAPVPAPWSAGIIGSAWPSGYATPPPFSNSANPGPTPNPNPNPVMYSQTVGDNGRASTNPYDETTSTLASVRPIMMNRPFRSVGEMSYAFRDQPFKTIDFSLAASSDAGLLDLFTVNEYTDSSGMRAGVVNLNTRQAGALAAVLSNTIRREDTPRTTSTGSTPTPSPQPSPLGATAATNIAVNVAAITSLTPVVNRAGLVTLIANETALGATTQKPQRESIARAIGEVGQTRTWNLMIDVVAQSGRFPSTASALKDFVVEGEKHYWLHVAVDRFTGQVIDQQLEAVYE